MISLNDRYKCISTFISNNNKFKLIYYKKDYRYHFKDGLIPDIDYKINCYDCNHNLKNWRAYVNINNDEDIKYLGINCSNNYERKIKINNCLFNDCKNDIYDDKYRLCVNHKNLCKSCYSNQIPPNSKKSRNTCINCYGKEYKDVCINDDCFRKSEYKGKCDIHRKYLCIGCKNYEVDNKNTFCIECIIYSCKRCGKEKSKDLGRLCKTCSINYCFICNNKKYNNKCSRCYESDNMTCRCGYIKLKNKLLCYFCNHI